MKPEKPKEIMLPPGGMYLEKLFALLLLISLVLLVIVESKAHAAGSPKILTIYQFHLNRVVDGDTLEVKEKFYPEELGRIRLRIRGIDAPETGMLAKCPAEKVKGQAAKQFLYTTLINANILFVRNISADKYGGRLDADIIVNTEGGQLDLGQWMVDSGFAKPYVGVGAKPNWCR